MKDVFTEKARQSASSPVPPRAKDAAVALIVECLTAAIAWNMGWTPNIRAHIVRLAVRFYSLFVQLAVGLYVLALVLMLVVAIMSPTALNIGVLTVLLSFVVVSAFRFALVSTSGVRQSKLRERQAR